jgi:O-antigen ligase
MVCLSHFLTYSSSTQVDNGELLSLLSLLTKDIHVCNTNVHNTIREAIQGGGIVGLMSTAGALLLGPAGFLAGV